jgi:hypothetical protein
VLKQTLLETAHTFVHFDKYSFVSHTVHLQQVFIAFVGNEWDRATAIIHCLRNGR